MFGPIPTTSSRLHTAVGPSGCYGTAASAPARKGLSSPLPFNTGSASRITFRGPVFAQPVAVQTVGVASDLLGTIVGTSNLSGTHAANDVFGVASGLLSTIVGTGTLSNPSNLHGDANSLFTFLTGVGILSKTVSIVGMSSSTIDFIGVGILSKPVALQGAATITLADASNGYLYVTNFSVGPLKFSASIAW